MNPILGYIIDQILERKFLSHVLYWIVLFLILILYGIGYGQFWKLSLYLTLIYFPSVILAYYTFIHVQLPLLYKRKYWLFVILFFVFLYVFQVLVHFNNDFGFGTKLISSHKPHGFFEIFVNTDYGLRMLVDVYIIVFISVVIKLVKDHIQSKQEIDSLEAERAASELQLLQSRIHPEFLLGSLDLIARQSESDYKKTAKSIINLSELLDYSLYQSDQNGKRLKVESKKLGQYLALISAQSKLFANINYSEVDVREDQKVTAMMIVKIAEYLLREISKLAKSNVQLEIALASLDKACLLDFSFSSEQEIDLLSEDLITSDLDNIFNNHNKETLSVHTFKDGPIQVIQIKINLWEAQ